MDIANQVAVKGGECLEGKYIVGAVGVLGAAAVGVANLYFKGPDSTVTVAIVSAITFIAGLAFGYIKK